MDAIADRVAAPENDEAFALVDASIDQLIALSQAILDNIPKVKTTNPKERKAVGEIKKITEEAILPYLMDIVDQAEAFGVE